MPRVVDHEAHRAALATAALRVLAAEGYAAAGMRRIAAEAGVSVSSFYHYFPDKGAVVAHAFEVLIGQHELLVRAAVVPETGADERADIVLAFVRAHQRSLLDLIRVGLDVHRYEPALRPLVARSLARYREVTSEVLGVPEARQGHAAVAWLIGALVSELLDPGGLLDAAQEDVARSMWIGLLGG